MRFFTVLAALDTGSAFEGMGASREVQFSVLAEPALLLSLLAMGEIGELALTAGMPESLPRLSLSGIYASLSFSAWMHSGTVLLLAASALLIILLTENARIPVDDPNTHLELTMIHEVMVLDHSGPDFGMILYGAAIKTLDIQRASGRRSDSGSLGKFSAGWPGNPRRNLSSGHWHRRD